MNEYKVTTYSEEETLAVAQNIESEKFPNMIITLNGDLGSGKTVFTKGLAHLGLEEYFTKGGIVVIEWADMIKEYLPKERLDVKIKIIDENTRVLIFIPHGEKYEQLCEAAL